MRLVLIGRSSFISRHLYEAANSAGLDTVTLPHDANLSNIFSASDVIVNLALAPEYTQFPYRREYDCDLRAAQAACRVNARTIMLSTRRVYPEEVRWGAKETAVATGDETQYGHNKALTEAAVRGAVGDSGLILRLSNIIGFEYDVSVPRMSFMGQLLHSLRTEGRIYYDMHLDTCRDFLPVQLCAEAIILLVQTDACGTFNLGCGFPVSCGELASWVLEGFGTGTLETKNGDVRDSFYLDMTKWNAQYPALLEREYLKTYVTALGWRLRDS